MFCLNRVMDNETVTIVFATYEKVVSVLTDLRWDGSLAHVREILRAMESITTDNPEIYDAATKCCMACGGEWFNLTWVEGGTWDTECLTGDPMTGGYEHRDLYSGTEYKDILALLQTMVTECDADGVPL